MRLNILSQVTIDPDESSEAFLVFSGSHIKHEEQGEEAIYINSDDGEVTRPHCVLVNPRLMNSSDFPQPPEAIATLVQRLRPNLTPAIASRSFPPPVPLQPRLFTAPPPNLSTLPPTPVVSQTTEHWCCHPAPLLESPPPLILLESPMMRPREMSPKYHLGGWRVLDLVNMGGLSSVQEFNQKQAWRTHERAQARDEPTMSNVH